MSPLSDSPKKLPTEHTNPGRRPFDLGGLKSIPEWMSNLFSALVVLIALLVVFLALVALGRLTIDLLGDDSQRASDAVRTFLPLAAAAVGLPLLIWRLMILDRQTRINEEKTQIDRETLYTTIFSKSVELMGQVREMRTASPDGTSKVNSIPNTEARLGALYSLERLLAESEKDQRAILETLCAYVRENSAFEVPDDDADRTAFLRGKSPPAPSRRADIQAAITIIGRRPKSLRAHAEKEGWALDFRNANLIAYDFSGLNYDRSDLSNSFLDGTNMSNASLANSILSHTFLRGADLRGTCFRGAFLDRCDLTKARIEATNFQQARLVEADLLQADVTSFSIEGANLEEAFPAFRLQVALEQISQGGQASYLYSDILKTAELFAKASFDKHTIVSEEVRDAVNCINSRVQEPQTSS